MNKKIPKYVQELMSRSRYEFDSYRWHLDYAAGYTITIRKYSAYERVDTFKKEVQRLIDWCNRMSPESATALDDGPHYTRYCHQTKTVTIFDPVMRMIEQFIPHA